MRIRSRYEYQNALGDLFIAQRKLAAATASRENALEQVRGQYHSTISALTEEVEDVRSAIIRWASSVDPETVGFSGDGLTALSRRLPDRIDASAVDLQALHSGHPEAVRTVVSPIAAVIVRWDDPTASAFGIRIIRDRWGIRISYPGGLSPETLTVSDG